MSGLPVLTAETWLLHAGGGQRRFSIPEPDAATREHLHTLFGRPISAVDAVRAIVEDVRDRGDVAAAEWTERIDGVEVETAHAEPAWMAECWSSLPGPVRNALAAAAERIRTFHDLQVDVRPRGHPQLCLRPEPLRRVGCYVPGGRAAYPSTVLMNVIPAQAAGVASLVITSPPTAEGTVHPLVGAAAHLLHIDEVHAVGGAQAIAAMAYGTATIAAVDKVVGPGNLFVTLAKREVFGAVDIDQLAGPSEIMVVASDGADPRHVAADLISQLEHDPLAWAVCVTDSPGLAESVRQAFDEMAPAAARAGIIGESAGRHGAVVLIDELEQALALTLAFAPEHLSLQGAAAEALRDRVRGAGAVFCGALSPVSMGDYVAGPNHTLPTQGAARYRGPLSVMDFVRWPSVVALSVEEFDALAPVACVLATAEGLHGHEQAIRLRMGGQS
ncbi:MAG TPA: histidinol dehydrogenase [Candidatus Dormibacteraeota bacterium]|jgi:histidinol dehydrogenase|nr:histidinol dehydrogenase [Candidatus Dormibacteraeota bacterium]